MRNGILGVTAIVAVLSWSAVAAQDAGGHASGHGMMGHGAQHGAQAGAGHGPGHGATDTSADSASTRAFRAANTRMHADMDLPFTGDADADFIRGMIPHHRGAVEMAEIVLEHGTDPEVRALAEAIIAAQNEEIAFMQRWLQARGLD